MRLTDQLSADAILESLHRMGLSSVETSWDDILALLWQFRFAGFGE
jgi:hypothetical protein